MGFRTLHSTMKEIADKHGDTARGRGGLQLIQNQPAVDLMRRFYEHSPLLKVFMKEKMCSTFRACVVDERPIKYDADDETVRLFSHTIRQLSLHDHAPDLQVREWAVISKSILDMPDVEMLLCSFISEHFSEGVRDMFRFWLNHTLSDCMTKGCIVMPL